MPVEVQIDDVKDGLGRGRIKDAQVGRRTDQGVKARREPTRETLGDTRHSARSL